MTPQAIDSANVITLIRGSTYSTRRGNAIILGLTGLEPDLGPSIPLTLLLVARRGAGVGLTRVAIPGEWVDGSHTDGRPCIRFQFTAEQTSTLARDVQSEPAYDAYVISGAVMMPWEIRVCVRAPV